MVLVTMDIVTRNVTSPNPFLVLQGMSVLTQKEMVTRSVCRSVEAVVTAPATMIVKMGSFVLTGIVFLRDVMGMTIVILDMSVT
jgi:hypothetical protein